MSGRWQTKVVNVALLALCMWAVPNVGFGQGSGPKTYCVLDLSAGAEAAKFPITYLDAEPAGGFNTTEYKTTKLVLKRVEPDSFIMGTNQTDEARRVTLSRPFYLGLFEVTQKQWECVMGSVPEFYLRTEERRHLLGDALPVAYVSHTDIRGDARDASYETNVGTNDTFLVRLRAKTGLAFDLPTEAQWEHACRAGTTTVYSYGDEPDGAYAWSYDNSYYEDENYYDVHEVGTKKPNPWGFYDMHGNAQEWCRDVYVRDALYPYEKDPFVTVMMDNTDWRTIRGGGYILSDTQNTSAYRARWSYKDDGAGIGFRLGLDVGGIATTYGPFVPGEPVSIALPDLVGYAAKGLPAGLKFNAKTGAITGAATKPTAADGVAVTFTKRGEEPLPTKFIVGPFPVLSVGASDAPAGCKVTGEGAYAAGKKVTLRATAAKGCVFAGWYTDAAFSTPHAGTGDVDYRTPSLPYVMGTSDASLFAKFVAVEDDAAALAVPAVGESVPKTAIEPIALDVSGCVSLPKVTVKGLPPGLKFTAKALDVKATKTTPTAHYAANSIYGTPTKSGVYNATFTVTTAGKKTATETVTFVVIDREKGERVLKIVADAAQGKVTGVGVYAAGTKVTLKATAAKGYVFAGWYRDENCGVQLEDEGGLDFRTPSFPYVVPDWGDTVVYAKFAPSAQDMLTGIGVYIHESEGSYTPIEDGVYTSGASNLRIDAASHSLPKFSVSGLPPGLKFTAKQLRNRDGTVLADENTIYGTATKPGAYVVTVKATNTTVKKAIVRQFRITVDDWTDANDLLRVTDADGREVRLQNWREDWYREQYTVYAGVVEHDLPSIVASNATDRLTISGLPTGLKYDAKEGKITGVPTKAGFYTVTATVRSGRASSVSTFTVEVKPLYEWVVGTFVGTGNHRMEDYESITNNLYGTFTVAANGKVSGKVLFDTGEGRLLTATFSAPSLTGYDEDQNVYYCDVSLAFKDGRKVVDEQVQVRRLYIGAFFYEFRSYDPLIGGAWMDGYVDKATDEDVEDGFSINFRQNVWKRKGFEKLPQFAERKMSVLLIDAPLPPDPSDPEIVSSTASLKLDIDQKGSVAATLTLDAVDEDGDQFSRRLVAKGDLIVDDFDSTGGASGRGVYTAGVPLVFGNFGLLRAKVRMEVSADGKVWAEGCRIMSVDRFASVP